jgi:hypothetical protein
LRKTRGQELVVIGRAELRTNKDATDREIRRAVYFGLSLRTFPLAAGGFSRLCAAKRRLDRGF